MIQRALATLLLLSVCLLTSAAQTGLKLTEVMYDVPVSPNGDANGDNTRQSAGDEFVELYNSTNASIDLSAYQIIEREGQVVFTFPINAILAPKQFVVVFGNAVAEPWGSSFPAGTLKYSHYTGATNQGFGPVTTSTGTTKSNLASNGDRIMIVNPLLADTVAEVAWGYDNNVPPRVVKPLWTKGTYIAGTSSVKGDTIQGSINQSLHLQMSTGKWGRHKDVANPPDTSRYFSPGAFTNGTTSVGRENDPLKPAAFTLHQNYPNPFNPTTVISFSLSAEQHVRLYVVNELGEEVATLIDKRLGAGQFFANFDGRNVASGVYLVTLEADGMKVTRKMALVK